MNHPTIGQNRQVTTKALSVIEVGDWQMSSSVRKSLLLISGLALLAGLSVPVSASPNVGGTDAWTTLNSPSVTTLQSQTVVVLTFHNNLNITVLGEVVVVVHNSQGQTIFLSGATTLNIPAGQSLTAYAVVFGVSSGTYNTSLFAISPSGVAISAPISAALSL